MCKNKATASIPFLSTACWTKSLFSGQRQPAGGVRSYRSTQPIRLPGEGKPQEGHLGGQDASSLQGTEDQSLKMKKDVAWALSYFATTTGIVGTVCPQVPVVK